MGLIEKLDYKICLFPGCGEPTHLRTDGMPLCSKHSKKFVQFYAKVRPDQVTDDTYPMGSPVRERDEG